MYIFFPEVIMVIFFHFYFKKRNHRFGQNLFRGNSKKIFVKTFFGRIINFKKLKSITTIIIIFLVLTVVIPSPVFAADTISNTLKRIKDESKRPYKVPLLPFSTNIRTYIATQLFSRLLLVGSFHHAPKLILSYSDSLKLLLLGFKGLIGLTTTVSLI